MLYARFMTLLPTRKMIKVNAGVLMQGCYFVNLDYEIGAKSAIILHIE